VYNNLIQVVEGGVTRATLYDGQTPLLDFNGSGSVTARYMSVPNAIDEILSRETSGGVVAWYITDRLGTVRDLINNSGSVIDHVDYTVFGRVSNESSPSNGDRFKFAGMELDAVTGLDYDRARWFDSVGGKFIGRDPIGFGGGDANDFRYVKNNVINDQDTRGLQAKSQETIQTFDPQNPGKLDPTKPMDFHGPELPDKRFHPTGQELADPKLFPAIAAWNDALRDLSKTDLKERGYCVFKLKGIPDKNIYRIIPTDTGGEFRINLNSSATTEKNSNFCPIAKWSLEATVHTHPPNPNGKPDPKDSPDDPKNANRPVGKSSEPVPWLVIGPDGTIFLIGPDKRGGPKSRESRNLGIPANNHVVRPTVRP
jgi:RHS repeat-associated protein